MQSQFIRYLLVGGASFALEYALYWLLYWLGLPYLWANSTAYLTVFVVNFLVNRSWTFGSSGHLGRQALLYLLLVLFNLLASNVVLYALVEFAAVPALVGKVAVMVMIVSWNFVLYRKVIYR
ncbi:MAG TPA: GtrA family protein [Chitinolyticbacter sp.]|uniref:GtrA family protein n=1 Tax=Chitinolyticbacter albus TaxID=2961951 RepID=UPI00210AA147|nr:GtrA family protein [Chitinolyticbacter albus]HSC79961.1 GtrA family protein [Chitinolyticbacter sp.]